MIRNEDLERTNDLSTSVTYTMNRQNLSTSDLSRPPGTAAGSAEATNNNRTPRQQTFASDGDALFLPTSSDMNQDSSNAFLQSFLQQQDQYNQQTKDQQRHQQQLAQALESSLNIPFFGSESSGPGTLQPTSRMKANIGLDSALSQNQNTNMDGNNHGNGGDSLNSGTGTGGGLNANRLSSGLNSLSIQPPRTSGHTRTTHARSNSPTSHNSMTLSSNIDSINYGQQTVLSVLNASLEEKTSPNRTAETSRASESYIPENSSISSIHSQQRTNHSNIMSIARHTIPSNNNDMTNNQNNNVINEYIPSHNTNVTMNIRNNSNNSNNNRQSAPAPTATNNIAITNNRMSSSTTTSNKNPYNSTTPTSKQKPLNENAIHFAFFLPSGQIEQNEKTISKDILFKVHIQIYYQIDGPTNIKSVHETHKWLSDIKAVHNSLGFLK